VALNGTVPSYPQYLEASAAAQRVAGEERPQSPGGHAAVGGTSPEAHQAGLDRIAQAGDQPTSVVQVGCELQRDWTRQETAEGFTQILFGGEQPPGRGSQRARWQRSSRGPLTHHDLQDTPSAMSPPEVGWRRNWPYASGAIPNGAGGVRDE